MSRLATPDARPRAARGAAQEALRAAAVPQALRHQPESARAAGQGAAGLRPRREMDQVFEILCHRERANSVLLLGEPGVGKTAIAEGLARLIEFEPERVPVRLRDCQIVNLQMNTMVAGTMLRGMFEDRIQNVIREIKERPNLILFIDEVHTMIGAGSALGAPSDAGQHLQVGARARRSAHHRRDDAQRVQGIHPGRRGAGAPLPHRAHRRADASTRRGTFSTACGRGSSATTRCASRTRRSRRRSRCRRATCATCSCPTKSSAGSTPPRSRPRSRGAGTSPATTSSTSSRRSSQIPEDMVFRDVHRSLPRRREHAQRARRRTAPGDRRRGAAPGAEQGSAQGWIRSAGRRAAVPRADRRRQDRAGEVGRAVPVRRREEDDPRRHVRVSGWRGRRRQADRHAARHRRFRARRRADQPAEGPPVFGRAARRGREGEPERC